MWYWSVQPSWRRSEHLSQSNSGSDLDGFNCHRSAGNGKMNRWFMNFQVMRPPLYQHYLKIHEQPNYAKLFPLDMLEFEFQWWRVDHTTLLCQSQAPSQHYLASAVLSCYTLVSLTVFQFCSSVSKCRSCFFRWHQWSSYFAMSKLLSG
jgi:hypothetical protein